MAFQKLYREHYERFEVEVTPDSRLNEDLELDDIFKAEFPGWVADLMKLATVGEWWCCALFFSLFFVSPLFFADSGREGKSETLGSCWLGGEMCM